MVASALIWKCSETYYIVIYNEDDSKITQYCNGFLHLNERRTKAQRGCFDSCFNKSLHMNKLTKNKKCENSKQSYLVHTQRQEQSPTNTQ
jgi:hypothetical protein